MDAPRDRRRAEGWDGWLRKAIALASYAGLRKKDVAELLATARSNGIIATTQSKTGHELSMFEARRLSDP